LPLEYELSASTIWPIVSAENAAFGGILPAGRRSSRMGKLFVRADIYGKVIPFAFRHTGRDPDVPSATK
jgi:hypothetical protein